jgi:adenylate cyclase
LPAELTEEEMMWIHYLTVGEAVSRHMYHFLGIIPSGPRCKLCNSPFRSWGGFIMRLIGRDQSRYNPRYCANCEQFEHPGGAEIVLSMLFADVRGSSTLAERMSALDFSRLMGRLYNVATDILVKNDAMVDRLIGDEVVGLFIPGLAGKDHSRRAIEAARGLLEATGHSSSSGPWLPLGIGVHTGPAYVGVVGGTQGTLTDFTALGDNVNITARLASQAGSGEVLISDSAFTSAGLDLGHLEHRQLDLKGKSESTGVNVLRL